MEVQLILLLLNLFFGVVNHKMENYKTSALSFFAAGALLAALLLNETN